MQCYLYGIPTLQVYSLDKKDIMMHSFNEHVFVLSE